MLEFLMYKELKSKRKMERCRKRDRKDVSVPILKIFQKQMTEIPTRDYDSVAETQSYENAKNTLCLKRRKVLRFAQNRADSMDILF